MTVRMLMQQLLDYPMDYQVLDTTGDPIMYVLHANDGKAVRLEPKSQMDVNVELRALFENATECGESDRDTYDDLMERGFTLEDLKNYREDTYEWAKRIAEEE